MALRKRETSSGQGVGGSVNTHSSSRGETEITSSSFPTPHTPKPVISMISA